MAEHPRLGRGTRMVVVASSACLVVAGFALLALLRPWGSSGTGPSVGAFAQARFMETPLRPLMAGPNANTGYVVLGANDLGMHCYQKSYKAFMVLPPANTLRVQVFKRGGEGATLVRSGIKVHYEMVNNTTSVTKTDFWTYASHYGWNLAPDEGITGNYLTGNMALSKDTNYWVAEYIPVTPYTDDMKWNPYQKALVTVKSTKTGKVLGTQTFVIPVSDEMRCDYCHGSNFSKSILQSHDTHNGTTLYTDYVNGTPHSCSECHKDNALGAPGIPGVQPLSQAMHGFHADKMQNPKVNKLETLCYACHPGPKTKCLRGAMYNYGKTCTDCHGDMRNVADTQAHGREAWLDEPKCATCHGSKYAENASTLYRFSYLKNGPENMNGFIMCESCHNSTHAEWTSTKNADNKLPIHVQGLASYIQKCTVCHDQEDGSIHR